MLTTKGIKEMLEKRNIAPSVQNISQVLFAIICETGVNAHAGKKHFSMQEKKKSKAIRHQAHLNRRRGN